MATYRITRSLERAQGWTSWLVEASSEQEAIQKYNDVGGEYEAEEVQITEYGEPEARLVKGPVQR